MTCAHAHESLGAYVLGSLEPADHEAVVRHLDDCPQCAAECSELEALTPLLARLSLEDLEASAPSEELYARTVAAMHDPAPAAHRLGRRAGRPARHGGDHRSQDRGGYRRLRLVGVAAGLVLALAVGAGVVAHAHRHDPDRFTASQGPIHISVDAEPADAGTTLIVHVAGLPEKEHCHLVAVAQDGSWHTAGDWVATYSGKAQVTGSTDVPRTQLAQLVLFGTDNRELVRVHV